MAKKRVKDVFRLWQIEKAEFTGNYGFPVIHGTSKIPESIVLFSKCKKEKDVKNKAVHFYEFDETFESCLSSKNKLSKMIKIFRNYQSVILPDYSVYRDFPLAMQIFQMYKSRAVGNFLMQNGINVIPNVRWGDEKTYDFAFDGIEKYGVVAVGVLGGYRDNETKLWLEKGFLKMLEVLEPETILCYGKLSEDMFLEAKRRGVKVVEYPTEVSKRKAKVDSLQLSIDFM